MRKTNPILQFEQAITDVRYQISLTEPYRPGSLGEPEEPIDFFSASLSTPEYLNGEFSGVGEAVAELSTPEIAEITESHIKKFAPFDQILALRALWVFTHPQIAD